MVSIPETTSYQVDAKSVNISGERDGLAPFNP